MEVSIMENGRGILGVEEEFKFGMMDQSTKGIVSYINQ
jgi:hypothetical protein